MQLSRYREPNDVTRARLSCSCHASIDLTIERSDLWILPLTVRLRWCAVNECGRSCRVGLRDLRRRCTMDGTTTGVLFNIAAASTAGACQISIFHPLDCLRIRWQLAGGDARGWLAFTMDIVRKEGWWHGLHRPGLPANLLAVAGSQGLRLGVYPSVRDQLLGDKRPLSVEPHMMATAGLISGSLAYFLSAPLWLIKTRFQAAAQIGGTGGIRWPATLWGYWVGCTPLVVRGAMLTSGHMAGYDGTKRFARSRDWIREGPLLHVFAAMVAGVAAATLSAPADVFQTRMQSGSSASAMQCIADVWRADGPIGFFRGWSVNCLRRVPTFIVGSVIYEQVRKLLGLGYFV